VQVRHQELGLQLQDKMVVTVHLETYQLQAAEAAVQRTVGQVVQEVQVAEDVKVLQVVLVFQVKVIQVVKATALVTVQVAEALTQQVVH
jgi:hypothetical protein